MPPASNGINHLVHDVVITRCMIAGIFFNDASSGSILRRNVITQTGGYTGLANSNVEGIRTMGGVRMDDNFITDVIATGTGSAFGILGTAGDFMIGNASTNVGDTGVSGGKYQRNIVTNFTATVSGGTNAGSNF